MARLISQPDPEFVQAIKNGLAFWYKQSQKIDAVTIVKLNAGAENLIRILDFALKLPDCWQATAELMAQVFQLPDRMEYWGIWLEKLSAAIESSPQSDNDLTNLLQIQYGKLQRILWQLNGAIDTHQQTLTSARNLQNKELEAKAGLELAWDYYTANKLPEAVQAGKDVLQLYRDEVAAPIQHVDTLRVIGNCETKRGNWQAAEAYLQEAYETAQHLPDVIVHVRTLNGLGVLHRRKGNYEKSLSYFIRMKALLADTAYSDDKSYALLNIGSAHFDLGNLDAAQAAFDQGYHEYASKSSNMNRRMHFINNLGNVYWKKGQLLKAEAYLRDALSMRPLDGGEVGRADNMVTLARVLFEQQKMREIHALIDEAEKMLQNFLEFAWTKEILADIENLRREMRKQQH